MPSLETTRGLDWIVLFGTFLGVAIWESARPKQRLVCREGKRWTCHLILLFSESLLLTRVLRWSGPVLTAAALAGSRHGLFNRLSLPLATRWVVTILLLDLTNYATHRACHAVPILWRVHQVHHSDPDFDVTTAGRFHPVESVFSDGAVILVVALLAPPVAAIIVWRTMSAFLGLFVHANATLPRRVEKLMRMLCITPDLHRIHHSIEISEQGRNLGALFPVWDRMFGTYLGSAAAGQEAFQTGLKEFPTERAADLVYLLALPFRSQRQPATEAVTAAAMQVPEAVE